MTNERKLINKEITIFEALKNIENGKYVMPAFQRQYVWNLEQIEKLWDSILSDYPISTFLFWHLDETNTTDDTFFCTFMKEMEFKKSKQEPSLENYSVQSIDLNSTDTGILDGQQRLTSLYLSLFGDTRISGKGKFTTKLYIELDERKVETDGDEVNSKSYGFDYLDKIGLISPTKFEIKKLIDEKFQNKETRDDCINSIIQKVIPEQRNYAFMVLSKMCEKIYDEKIIRYSEIYGMKQDDALEMFVRFNNGGKPLKKSDITMAIFDVYWPMARTEFGRLENSICAGFGTDFIVRTALMLYGDVSKSCIDRSVANTLRDNWNNFCNSIVEVRKVLLFLNLKMEDFSKRWNVLLPIIYLINRNPDYEENLDGIRCYLFRALFFTYFQNGTTAKLAKMRNAINDFDFNITEDLLEQITELRLNNQKIEDILNTEKGNLTNVVLNVLYKDIKQVGLSYEQDHIHPRIEFDYTAPINVDMKEWQEWHKNRDKLPNLQLLDKHNNRLKSDVPLIDWYNDLKTEEARKKFKLETFIPDNVSLELKAFGDFYEARKELLRKKIKDVLSF